MGATGARALNEQDPAAVGPYRILAVIGVGGMGTVYLGERAGSTAAVKTVHPHLAANPDFRARFRRETEAARRVRSVCCAEFYDADPTADRPWLAMEYVQGPSLSQAVEHRGPITGRALVAFAGGLAEAVTALHTAGIVHRDLKPSNIILAAAGPRVIDFGIARLADGEDLTRTGQSAGSPGWMAPEQFSSEHIGPPVDVFAWAATVAFAGTGTGPFVGPTPQATILRTLNDPPQVAGLPPELQGLCLRALDKDPAQRPTAAEVLAAVVGPSAGSGSAAGGAVPVTALLQRSWVAPPPTAVPPPPSGPPPPPTAPYRPPPAPPTPPPPAVPPPPSGTPKRRIVEVGVVVLLLLVAVGLGAWKLASNRNDGSQATTGSTSSSDQTTTKTTSSSTSQPKATSAPSSATSAPPTSATVTIGPAGGSGSSGGSSTGTGGSGASSTKGISLGDAEAKVQSLGFTPDTEVGFDGSTLSAIGGHTSGAADGGAGVAFFFANGRYLGTDASQPSYDQVRISGVDDSTVAVEYELYRDADPHCCPSAGTVSVRYHWNGTRLVPEDTIPPTTGAIHR